MLSTKATSSRNRKKHTSRGNNCKFTPHSPGLQTYEAPEDRAGLPALIRRNPCGPLAELSIPHPETLPIWTIPRPSLSPRRFPWLPRPFPSPMLVPRSLSQYSILGTLVTRCPGYRSKELCTLGCHSEHSSLNHFLWDSWSRLPDNMKQGNQRWC